MNITVRSFGVACYDANQSSPIYYHLAFFEFLPQWLFVFNSMLAVIDNDLYYLLASKFTFVFYYYYLLALSLAIRSPRPVGYDHVLCKASEFALPDATYVSTLSFVFIVGAGFLLDRRMRSRLGFVTRLLLLCVVALYGVSLWRNRYFSGAQLILNTLIAAASSGIFLYTYWKLWHQYNMAHNVRSWFARRLGYTDELFGRAG